MIPVNIPLKFIVAPIPLTSTEITDQLSRCEILNQSFDKQIRRILISSHEISTRESRSKSQSISHEKRSPNIDIEGDQTNTTDDVFHAELTTEKKRNDFRRHRTISMVSIPFSKNTRQCFFSFLRLLKNLHHENHSKEHYHQTIIIHIIHLFIQFK